MAFVTVFAAGTMPAQIPGVVGQLDQPVQRMPERAGEQVGERRRRARAGDVVDRDLADVGLRDPVVHPAEAERVEELLGEHGADVPAGDAVDDLAEDEAAGDGVVGLSPAGAVDRLGGAEDLAEVVVVVDEREVECLRGQVRNAGAMGENVADRDPVLAVALVAGDVLGDRVVERQQAPLAELVDHERGDRLRGRVDAERRLGRRGHPLGVAGSRGPLPRAWPIARSRITAPLRRTQTWIAGWTPLRNHELTAPQIASTLSASTPPASGAASSPTV